MPVCFTMLICHGYQVLRVAAQSSSVNHSSETAGSSTTRRIHGLWSLLSEDKSEGLASEPSTQREMGDIQSAVSPLALEELVIKVLVNRRH